MKTLGHVRRFVIGVTTMAAVVAGAVGSSIGNDEPKADEKRFPLLVAEVRAEASAAAAATRPASPARPPAAPAATTRPAHGGPSRGPAHAAPREWDSYEAMHQYFVDRFINSDGFGYERMMTPRTLARSNRLYHDGEFYTIGRVDLISLGGGDGKAAGGKAAGGKPFAYTTPRDAMKEALKKAKHRDLEEFEAAALGQLKEGKQAVVGGDPAAPVMVGAVRATEGCIKCHNMKEGELLGAFTYPLKAIEPPANAVEAPAKR